MDIMYIEELFCCY